MAWTEVQENGGNSQGEGDWARDVAIAAAILVVFTVVVTAAIAVGVAMVVCVHFESKKPSIFGMSSIKVVPFSKISSLQIF